MIENAPENVQSAVKQLWSVSNHEGSDGVIAYLKDRNVELSTISKDEIDAAVDVIGINRALQVLGEDTEIEIEIHHQPKHDESQKDDLLCDIHALWEAGTIARYRTQEYYVFNESGLEHQLYKECRAWAHGKNFELPPEFSKQNGRLSFPEIFAVIVDSGYIRGVYPHSHQGSYCPLDTVVDVFKNEDSLSCEVAQSWDAARSREGGPHGHFKQVLHEYPTEHFGAEWTDPYQEKAVGSILDPDAGNVDLIFRHEDGARYLLVEVKTDARQIDKAFGQLYRYKYRFLEDHPGVSSDQIELSIAAPDFWSAHVKAANELGINLVIVSDR